MRSSSLSFSVVNRGQSRENEQQAPQLRQSAAASGGVGANLFIPFCQIRPISAMQLAGNLMSWHGGLLSMKNAGHHGDVEHGEVDRLSRRIHRSPNRDDLRWPSLIEFPDMIEVGVHKRYVA